MPKSLSTPHASLNIYLTTKLPNLELCLLVLKAFMAQISELIRKKWERASHGGRISFRLSSWQEYVFESVVSRPNIQLRLLERRLDFPPQWTSNVSKIWASHRLATCLCTTRRLPDGWRAVPFKGLRQGRVQNGGSGTSMIGSTFFRSFFFFLYFRIFWGEGRSYYKLYFRKDNKIEGRNIK